MAFARLFYHKPKFAILGKEVILSFIIIYLFIDECTSACSTDIESNLYNYSKSLGITIITVSHRQSLWKHHNWVLKISGEVYK